MTAVPGSYPTYKDHKIVGRVKVAPEMTVAELLIFCRLRAVESQVRRRRVMTATQTPAPALASPCGAGAGPTSPSSTGEGGRADSGGVGVLDRAHPQPPAFEMVAWGEPKPQGSKKAFVNRKTGRAQMTEDNKGTKPWRETVKWAALATIDSPYPWQPLDGPLAVELVFTLKRPGFHFGSGRNARVLRDAAPAHPAKTPDVDKLTRACFDALTDAGVYRDDAQVYDVHAVKCFPFGHPDALRTPGVVVRIWQVLS